MGITMTNLKKILNRIFIDGLNGMALGLFSTLIVGTILIQIAGFLSGDIATYLKLIGKVASLLTGAGIGCGVAYKLKESPLVVISASVAGLVGAYATQILSGTILEESGVHMIIKAPGEPLGAFVAAYIAITIGHLVAGKTKVDIIVTPIVSILSGSIVGLFVGPGISKFMTGIGEIVNWGVDRRPIIMGIVVAVIMGIALTLPISSAAIGISLGLTGIAAGASVAGCCANMVGFAVASYRDNKLGGLVAQGVGTSMLQIPNIVRKPIIWLPAIITSAIVGPISAVLGMTNNPYGSGMGTSGLVGQLNAYDTMAQSFGSAQTLLLIAVVHFLLPAVLSFVISEFMRRKGFIKPGDMKLNS
jgi:uncharacterized membrane protein